METKDKEGDNVARAKLQTIRKMIAVLPWILVIVLLLYMAVQKAPRRGEMAIRPFTGSSQAAAGAFQKARARSGSTVEARRKAATLLTQRADTEGWIILLLLDEDTLSSWSDANDRRLRKVYELPVIASLLQGIPATASKEVLWAVTCKLSETGKGEYYTTGGVPIVFPISYDCQTRPIRDIARDTLKHCIGEDHGYAAEAWRGAILESKDIRTDRPRSRPASTRRR